MLTTDEGWRRAGAADEAIAAVRARLADYLPPRELERVRLWIGSTLCSDRPCLCYYAEPLWLAERVEQIMAWHWPPEFLAVYVYRRRACGQG